MPYYPPPTTGGGGALVTQVLIDFGVNDKTDEVFTIADAGISASSKINATLAWNTACDRDADEIMADPVQIVAEPLAGSMRLYAMASEGTVQGKYAINYQIG